MNTRRINVVLSMLVATLLVLSGALPYFSALLPTQELTASAATSTSTVDDYYADIDTSLTGEAFRSQLATLITNTHKKITTYDQLKSLYAKTDLDPANTNGKSNILLWYTGTSVTSYSSSGANREHVWPQSLGGFGTSRAGADAHHIRPCDSTLNSTRGNRNFGEVATTSSNLVNQKVALGDGSACYSDGTWFYPGEGYRGATARILMYVQTRWGEENSLKFVDGQGKSGSQSIGDFDTLYKWHLEEPVTEAEKLRNEAVYNIQGNRNPFIDHPEYAYMIYSEAGSYYTSSDSNSLAKAVQTLTKNNDTYNNINNEPPTSLTINGNLTVEAGKTTKLTISATPTNASKKVTWSTSDKSVATVSDDGTVTAIKQGTVTITATSSVNSSVKTTATITVTKARTVTQLSVGGTLTKKEYYAGDTLDPTGLTVTAQYDNGTSEKIALADCEWLDGTSGTVKLVEGSTSAICRYGGIDVVVSGIMVKASQVGSKTVKIAFSSFTGSGQYAWCTWNSGDVSGQAYIFHGNSSNQMQFNSSKDYYYLFNTTAFSGGIKSVTVKSTASKDWELRTNTTAYTSGVSKYPTSGTSQGEKTVTSDGTTWTVTGNPEYFTLNYKDTGAVYLTEIVITYGDESVNTDKVTLDKFSDSLTVGDTLTLTATASGSVTWSSSNTSVATVTNGVVKAVGAGKATITAKCGSATAQCVVTVSKPTCNHVESDWIVEPSTCKTQGTKYTKCTVCGETLQTEKLPLADHTRGDWQTEKVATCTARGIEYVACTVCGKVLDRRQTNTADHAFGVWVAEVPATCTQNGTVAHKDCVGCQKHFDANGNEIVDITIKANGHSFGRWQYTDGTLHRECGECGYAEQDTNKIDLFLASVNAAVAANSNSARFENIAQALTVYGYLTEDEQTSVETQYATLQGVIEQYNTDASKLNATHEEATQAAASIFAGNLALAALLLLLTKSLIRR